MIVRRLGRIRALTALCPLAGC